MSNLTHLLRHADPLHRDESRLETERERMRQVILEAKPAQSSYGSSMKSRRVVLVAVTTAVAVIAVTSLFWNQIATPLMAAVRFEVRLAEQEPTPGLVVAQLPDSSSPIYLHPDVVVSNDDISQSWVVDDGSGQFAVGVEFVATGAEKMRAATSRHVGRPMAVLLDGRVVIAPVLRSPISDSAVITGTFTKAEAERIAAGITVSY